MKGTVFSEGKNVLWGAGKNAIPVILALAMLEIHIDVICDSDVKRQGLRICNKMVVAPESFLHNESNCNVIISVDNKRYLPDILNSLAKSKAKNYVKWCDIEGAKTAMLHLRLERLDKDTQLIYKLIRDSYSKKIIIYGGRNAVKLQQLLKMLDVEVDYLVDDIEDEYDCMCEGGGYMIKPLYNLLYEKEGSFKVVVTSDREKNSNTLDKMDLQKGIDYDLVSQYDYTQRCSYTLDPNCGYNLLYPGDKKIPGFVPIGERDEAGTTIVLLGGSTTDGRLYAFGTWGDFLGEKLKKSGYKVNILNGACSGYQSSQELIKMIRDVLPIRPDIIIDYTGFNDALMYSYNQYSFIHQYQKDVYNQISGQLQPSWWWPDANIEKFTLGVPDERPGWVRFTDNIKIMESICRSFGIIYQSFFQPCLAVKEKSVQEKEFRIHGGYSEEFYERIELFYEEVKQIEIEHMEDITWLFDDEQDVYLDICHVNKRGNEMIAQYMYEYLTGKGVIKG